jgi:hypothetical protein
MRVATGAEDAATRSAVDATLAMAAERAREAAALLPDGPPPEWRGSASAGYALRLDALRARVAAIAPLLEESRRIALTTGGGGILG